MFADIPTKVGVPNNSRPTMVTRAVITALVVAMVFSLLQNILPTLASGPSSNRILNYQIRLTDPNGIPVADGTKNIIISFYTVPTGGTPVHTDCGTTGTPIARKVVVGSGIGTVVIGDTSASGTTNCVDASAPNAIPATLFDNTSLYIGLTVSPDVTEMTPRKRLTATGYALNSDKLDDLDSSATGGVVGFIPATDAAGRLKLTGDPTSSVAVITADPAAGQVTTDDLLLNLQNNDVSKFTVDAEGDTNIAGNILPVTDNTNDLGSTSLRWKTLHVGPGSVIVHNDATNTLKATLGFTGSTAQLATDTATPLKITTGANTGINMTTTGRVGINTASPISITALQADRLTGNGQMAFTSNGATLYPGLFGSEPATFPFTGGCANMQLAGGGSVNLSDSTSVTTLGDVDDAEGRFTAGCTAGTNEGLMFGIIRTGFLEYRPFAAITKGGQFSVRSPNEDLSVWRLRMDANIGTTQPRLLFGPGGSTGFDVSLVRTAADTLSVRNAANSADDALTAGAGTFSGTVTTSSVASATATALSINSGTTGTVNLGTDASAETINLGTGAANKTVVVGSTNTSSGTTIQSGTGNINFSPSGSGDTVTNIDSDSNAQFLSVAPAIDAVVMSLGTSSTDGVSGLNLTFGGSNANGNLISLNPSYAGGATDGRTFDAIQISGFAPTNASGTDDVNGLQIADLTDPGSTINSTALQVGSGWDSVLKVNNSTVINGAGAWVGAFNPGFTSGSAIFQGASGLAQDNANFFWDDTTNQLSIGPRTGALGGYLRTEDATNSAAATEVFTLARTRADATSPVVEDFGEDLAFRLEGTTNGTNAVANRIRSAWHDSFGGTASSYLALSTMWQDSLGEVMRITGVRDATSTQSPRRVGIGTTTPRSILDVVSDATNVGTITVQNTNGGSHSNTSYLDQSNVNKLALGYAESGSNLNTMLQNHSYLWFNSANANDLVISGGTSDPQSTQSTNTAVFNTAGFQTLDTANLDVAAGSFNTPYGGFGRYENGLLHSESFEDPVWTANGTAVVTANDTTAPDGTSNADTSTILTTGSISQTATAYSASGNTFTASVWLKNDGGQKTMDLRIDCGASAGTTVTVLTSPQLWQRFSVTQTCGAVAGNPTFFIIHNNAATIHLWGAQIEKQSTPGVYLRTTDTAITSTTNGLLVGGDTIAIGNSSSQTTFRGPSHFNGAITNNTTGDVGLNIISATAGTSPAIITNSTHDSASPSNATGNQFIMNNAQSTTAVTSAPITGVEIQFKQNTTIAGNDETALLVNLAQNSSASTDQAVASLIRLKNNDTASGNQITVTDGLSVLGTNVTNGINLSGIFGSTALKFSTTGEVIDYASAGDNSLIWKIPQRSGSNNCSNASSEGIIFQNTGGTQVGHICINGPTGSPANGLQFFASAFNTTSTDIAELYSSRPEDQLEPGDVVQLDAAGNLLVAKTTTPYASHIVGVVSHAPGIVLSGIDESTGKRDTTNDRPIALKGRVPVKVTDENGPIGVGDYLTSSSTPGYAMRATHSGMVIGRALDSFDGPGQGKIRMFVEIGPLGEASGLSPTSNFTANNFPLENHTPILTDITSITGRDGSWTVDSQGNLKVKTATAEAFAVQTTSLQHTVGQGMFSAGGSQYTVANPAITSSSKLFVSFRNDLGVRWWISEVGDGYFTVKSSGPAIQDTKFDYWILGVDDQGDNAVIPEPSATPAPTPEVIEPPITSPEPPPADTTPATPVP